MGREISVIAGRGGGGSLTLRRIIRPRRCVPYAQKAENRMLSYLDVGRGPLQAAVERSGYSWGIDGYRR